MMELKQSFKNHTFNIWMTVLGFILILYFFVFENGKIVIWESDRIFFAGFFILIDTLPSIFLHIEYTIIDWNKRYTITSDSLIVESDEPKRIINNEIKSIYIYKDVTLTSTGMLSHGNYSYIEVRLKSGESFIITSILKSGLHEKIKNLKGVPFVTKKKILPSTLIRHTF